jgi:hypothetical protein
MVFYFIDSSFFNFSNIFYCLYIQKKILLKQFYLASNLVINETLMAASDRKQKGAPVNLGYFTNIYINMHLSLSIYS